MRKKWLRITMKPRGGHDLVLPRRRKPERENLCGVFSVPSISHLGFIFSSSERVRDCLILIVIRFFLFFAIFFPAFVPVRLTTGPECPRLLDKVLNVFRHFVS